MTSVAKEYPPRLNQALAHVLTTAFNCRVQAQEGPAPDPPNFHRDFQELFSGDVKLDEQVMQPDYARLARSGRDNMMVPWQFLLSLIYPTYLAHVLRSFPTVSNFQPFMCCLFLSLDISSTAHSNLKHVFHVARGHSPLTALKSQKRVFTSSRKLKTSLPEISEEFWCPSDLESMSEGRCSFGQRAAGHFRAGQPRGAMTEWQMSEQRYHDCDQLEVTNLATGPSATICEVLNKLDGLDALECQWIIMIVNYWVLLLNIIDYYCGFNRCKFPFGPCRGAYSRDCDFVRRAGFADFAMIIWELLCISARISDWHRLDILDWIACQTTTYCVTSGTA